MTLLTSHSALATAANAAGYVDLTAPANLAILLTAALAIAGVSFLLGILASRRRRLDIEARAWREAERLYRQRSLAEARQDEHLKQRLADSLQLHPSEQAPKAPATLTRDLCS